MVDNGKLDAIWMTAALMSLVTCFNLETDDVEQVWPLKPTAASDLSWLEMQKGLRTLWQACDFEHNGGVFKAQVFPLRSRCLGVQLPTEGIDGIMRPLLPLCNITQSSDASNNPYFTAAHMLSQLLRDDIKLMKTLRFLSFPNIISPEFEAQIKRKDPVALVMMALWYELVEQSTWWMSGRAYLECRAIWTYLRRYHTNDPRIRSFVDNYMINDQSFAQRNSCFPEADLHCNYRRDSNHFEGCAGQN